MKYSFFILIILSTLNVFGQNTNDSFQSDLNFVYEKLKKSISYKTQKDRQPLLDVKYEELKSSSDNTETIIENYIKLYELIDVLNDNHNSITGTTPSFTYEDLLKKEFLSDVRTKPEYNNFPKINADLDSLENSLTTRKNADFEGIYHLDNSFKVAIFKNKNGMYQGVILETKIPSWQRGETILYLLPRGNNHFRMFTGGLIDKRLMSTKNYFDNGTFRAFGWTKSIHEQNFYIGKYAKERFVFKNISNSFNYLKLGTFSSSNQGIKQSSEFYHKIVDSLTSPSLIVDLRNNGGGGDKSSKQFLKLLKKYNGQIYLLTNYFTASNAEQFVIKLKTKKNIIVLGDRTAGVLSYGYNYGKTYVTPSENFKIQFTDLNDDWKKYLIYENVGIEPNIYLDDSSDWVEQIIKRYGR